MLNIKLIEAHHGKRREGAVRLWDGGKTGFGAKVSAAGGVTFYQSYLAPVGTVDDKGRDITGKRRFMGLGTYPDVSLADARQAAGDARRLLNSGIDPQEHHRTELAAKIERQEQDRREPTVEALASLFDEKHLSKRRAGAETLRQIEKDVLPRWGKRRAKDIRRADVIAMLDEVAERGPIAANRLLAATRKMFNFAIERDLLEVNPCHKVKAPGQEASRDRVLTDDEIRQFWNGLESVKADPQCRAALKLVLATGQRSGEVVGMRGDEVDGAWWTIPARRAKNGVQHRVPLNAPAKEILAALKPIDGWYFPSPIRKDGEPASIAANALSHVMKRWRDDSDMPHATVHDLRRTAATRLGMAGTSRHVIGLILNHKQSGVTSVYDRASYDAPKRRALEKWGRELQRIIAGKPRQNVVPMVRRAGA